MAKANYLLQIPADYQPLPVPVPPMLAGPSVTNLAITTRQLLFRSTSG
jgi:hypothetical protein